MGWPQKIIDRYGLKDKADLSRKTGIPKPTLTKAENNGTPLSASGAITLLRLSEFTGKTINELIDEID